MKKILIGLIISSSCIIAETFNAYTSHLPPFTLNMKEKGICHELVEELAKRTGHTINIMYLPWKRAQIMAQNDPKGLVFSISRTQNREEKYIWLSELTQANFTFVSIDKPINNFSEKQKLKKIVVLGGTPREKILQEKSFSNFEDITTADAAATFLNMGRADTWFTFDLRAKYLFKSLGFDQSKLIIGKPTQISHLWLGGNKKIDKNILPSFQKAIQEIQADGTYNAVFKKYLGG